MIPWKNVNVNKAFDQKETKGCDFDRRSHWCGSVLCTSLCFFKFWLLVSRLTGCGYCQQQHHEVRRLLELWRGSGEAGDWAKTTFPSQGPVTSSGHHHHYQLVLYTINRRWCIITEKAPTKAFSWLKAATTAFTFKTLLRHYAKQALTPR